MKVSILIPCYNAEQWIRAAIASALEQSYEDKEVIVVDDGSTDGSRDVIRSFGERVRSELTINRGGNAARNLLLALSTGEWLQYLDADDYLLAGKISEQVEHLQATTDIDVLFGPSLWRYENTPEKLIRRVEIPVPHDPWVLLVRWHLPQTGAPLWRRESLQSVGGWNEQQAVCQEHELYLRLLIAGKRFAYRDAAGAVYRHWSEDTVCRRDKLSTYAERLRIIDLAARHLEATGKLDDLRLEAVNQARFICARILWNEDRDLAKSTIEKINASDGRFTPEKGAAPLTYRIILKTLGFQAAEQVAGLTRPLRRVKGDLGA